METGFKRIRDLTVEDLSKIWDEATTKASFHASGQNGPPIVGLNPDGTAIYGHEDGTVSPFPMTGGPKTST